MEEQEVNVGKEGGQRLNAEWIAGGDFRSQKDDIEEKTEEIISGNQIFKKYFWSAYPFTVSGENQVKD